MDISGLKKYSLRNLTEIVDPDFVYDEKKSNVTFRSFRSSVWGYCPLHEDIESFLDRRYLDRDMYLEDSLKHKMKNYPTDEKVMYLCNAKNYHNDDFGECIIFLTLSSLNLVKYIIIFDRRSKSILITYDEIDFDKYLELIEKSLAL